MRWSAGLLLGLVAMCCFALTLEPGQPRQNGNLAPDEVYLRTTSRDRDQAATRLRDLSLVDSLSLDLRGAAPRGGFVLGGPPGLHVLDEPRIRSNARALLEARRTDQPVRLGLFLVPPDTHDPGARTPGRVRLRFGRIFAGTDDGLTFCMRVNPVTSGTRDSTAIVLGTPEGRRTEWVRDFGLCAWVVRYGLPGDDLSAWLKRYGGAVAREWNPPSPTRQDLDQLRLRFGGAYRDAGDPCRLGRPDACREVFAPDGGRITGAPRIGDAPGDGPWRLAASEAWGDWLLPNGVFDGALLAELEREFGVQAFQRFWTSDLSMAEAFEDAFGVDPGTWYAARTQPHWAGVLSEPGPRMGTVVTTLALLLLALWWSTVTSRRRTVQ
jgi:hypothetical protein